MSKVNTSGGGIGLGTLLLVVFVTLKLTGHIDWSWWWVTSPIWLPIALAAIVVGIIVLIAAFVRSFD